MKSSYSKYKIFNFPEKIQSLPLEIKKIHPPIHIRIKPINACDHDCSYCAYRTSNLSLGKDMDLKSVIPLFKMLELVDDFKKMNIQSVTFSGGGEPLRYPYITESLNQLIKNKINFAIITNGSNLKGRLAKLIALNASWVRVSIDGWDADSYSKYRNVKKDEFNKIIGNIVSYRNLNPVGKISINIIVDNENIYHLKTLLLLLINSGVDSIKLSPCVVSNNAIKNYHYHKPHLHLVEKSIDHVNTLYPNNKCIITNSFRFKKIEISKKNYSWCPYSQILPIIGADLNIYSCQDKAYTSSGLIGNIKDISFQDFWYSNKNLFFKINPSRDCHHHCVADEKNKMIHEFLNIDPQGIDFV